MKKAKQKDKMTLSSSELKELINSAVALATADKKKKTTTQYSELFCSRDRVKKLTVRNLNEHKKLIENSALKIKEYLLFVNKSKLLTSKDFNSILLKSLKFSADNDIEFKEYFSKKYSKVKELI